jgi:hypothetical protein
MVRLCQHGAAQGSPVKGLLSICSIDGVGVGVEHPLIRIMIRIDIKWVEYRAAFVLSMSILLFSCKTSPPFAYYFYTARRGTPVPADCRPKVFISCHNMDSRLVSDLRSMLDVEHPIIRLAIFINIAWVVYLVVFILSII